MRDLRPSIPQLIVFCILVLVGGADAPAGLCPTGCKTWFDGCNTCDCGNGQVTACTKSMCDRQEPARCVDPPAGPAPIGQTNEDGCLAYARAAVEQYDKLLAAGCNCWNARWHNNFEVHRTWCLGLPHWDASRPEFDIRQTDIGWCKNGRRPC